MRNKIINFFFNHRIIDSHIGVWKFHMWIYLLATYLDMHLISINIRIHRWSIVNFQIELNYNARPHNLSFKFTIFGVGIDTDKKYNQEIHKQYEEMRSKEKKALEDFRESLNPEQEILISQYEELR